MMVGLLWIFGSYAVSISLIHWCYRRERQVGRKAVRIWLITYNNQMQVEWFIRSLHFFSWLKGRHIQMTLADEGSTDETLAIAERLRVHYLIDIKKFTEHDALEEWIVHNEDQQVMVVRLGQQEVLETAFKML
jgi:hypothetical protein